MRRVLGTSFALYAPALGLLLVTLIYLAVAYRYKPDLRAFPAGVAWIMVVLLGLDLVSRTGTRIGAALTRWLNPGSVHLGAPAETQPRARQVSAVLWLVAFAALLVLVGILAAVPIYLFAALSWRGRRSYRACALGAAGATLFVWLLFAVVMRVALYPGLLFGGA